MEFCADAGDGLWHNQGGRADRQATHRRAVRLRADARRRGDGRAGRRAHRQQDERSCGHARCHGNSRADAAGVPSAGAPVTWVPSAAGIHDARVPSATVAPSVAWVPAAAAAHFAADGATRQAYVAPCYTTTGAQHAALAGACAAEPGAAGLYCGTLDVRSHVCIAAAAAAAAAASSAAAAAACWALSGAHARLFCYPQLRCEPGQRK